MQRQPTQVGRAMQQLSIPMIAAYSPQARGRSESSFRTWREDCRRSCGCAASGTGSRPTAGCVKTKVSTVKIHTPAIPFPSYGDAAFLPAGLTSR